MSSFDEVKGKAKQAWGDLTGDEKARAEGQADEARGHIKERFDDAKDKAGEKVNELLGKANDKLEKNEDEKQALCKSYKEALDKGLFFCPMIDT